MLLDAEEGLTNFARGSELSAGVVHAAIPATDDVAQALGIQLLDTILCVGGEHAVQN